MLLQTRGKFPKRLADDTLHGRVGLDAQNFANIFVQNAAIAIALYDQGFLGFRDNHLGLELGANWRLEKLVADKQAKITKKNG
jgi:hypothetical protein